MTVRIKLRKWGIRLALAGMPVLLLSAGVPRSVAGAEQISDAPSLSGPGVIHFSEDPPLTNPIVLLLQGLRAADGSCSLDDSINVPARGLTWNIQEEIALDPATCQYEVERAFITQRPPGLVPIGAVTIPAATPAPSAILTSSVHRTDLFMWTWWHDPLPNGGIIVSQVGSRVDWDWNGSNMCTAYNPSQPNYVGNNQYVDPTTGWQHDSFQQDSKWPDCSHIYSAVSWALDENDSFCAIATGQPWLGKGLATYTDYDPNQVTGYADGTGNLHSVSNDSGGCTALLSKVVYYEQYVDGQEVGSGNVG